MWDKDLTREEIAELFVDHALTCTTCNTAVAMFRVAGIKRNNKNVKALCLYGQILHQADQRLKLASAC